VRPCPYRCDYENQAGWGVGVSETSDVLRVLGWDERSELSVLDLRAGTVELLPLDAKRMKHSVHRVIALRSWIAVDCFEEVWAFPRPLSGTPRLVAKTFSAVPNLDGKALWVQDPNDRSSLLCVDATGSQVAPRVVIPLPHVGLHAITEHGWLLKDMESGLWWWDGQAVTSLGIGRVEASSSQVAVLVHRPDPTATTGPLNAISTLDLASRTLRPLHVAPKPDYVSWAEFSPDGGALALVVRYESKSHIAVGDVEAGVLRVVPDLRDVHRPFWSADGRQLVVPTAGKHDVDGVSIIDRSTGALSRAPFPPGSDLPLPVTDVAFLL
jgi:hypothetical protein